MQKQNCNIVYIIENVLEKALPLYLQKEGFQLEIHLFNEKIAQRLNQLKPEIIIFDFNSNEAEYIEQLHLLKNRSENIDTKIVFYTNIKDPYFELASYEAGIDLFINKPKKNRLFFLLLKKLISYKKNKIEPAHKNRSNQISIDRERFVLIKNGVNIILSKKEFELVELLLKKPGKVFTRNEIAQLIWQGIDVSKTRTIDVHIRKLRDKLGIGIIKTVKGIGYYIDKKAVED